MAIITAAPEGAETFNATAGLLRLRTLVRLRWLAVFGQSLAVLGVHFILDFPLRCDLSGVIALSAWLNIFHAALRSSLRLAPTSRPASGYDSFNWRCCFILRGLENPFAFLFLVP